MSLKITGATNILIINLGLEFHKNSLFYHSKAIGKINFFSWFSSWKVKEKIQLGVKKSNLKIFLDILIHHKDIRV